MSLLKELRRRNVIRMAGLYLVGAWLVTQVAGTVLPMFGAPEWLPRSVVLLLVIGFIPALVFAWVFELTPEGLKRDADVPREASIAPQTAQRMNRMIIAVLMLALVYFGFDKFVLAPRREAANLAVVRDDAKLQPAVAPAQATATIPAKSIAVLPFENLSEDKANGYFADGIQDQILTGLAKIGDLKVISRTSTRKYASRPDNLSKIARELGVAHILEGSVQRSGNRVRINVQLIEAATDSHLWADSYDRTLDDVFKVESEVAQKIAESLAANLSRGELAALSEKPTNVPAAYEAYLKARASSNNVLQNREQADALLSAYRHAVQLDPAFAMAWAQLARESFRAHWVGFDSSGTLQAEGERALARATGLAPGSPQAELARGVHTYYIERDFPAALAIMNSLKPKLPNDPDVWMWAGYLSRRLGLWEESAADFKRAHELSPNDANVAYHLGVTLITASDCARGLPEVDAALRLEPNNTHALAIKLQCAWFRGDMARASALLAAEQGDAAALQGLRGQQLLYQRKYEAASRALRAAVTGSDDTVIDAFMNGYVPARVEFKLQLALSQQRAGAAADAQALYAQVKTEAMTALAGKPDNRYVEAGWRVALGQALAGLGERDAAAAQGRLAVSLAPASVDKLEGPGWEVYLARILALNGDAGNAVPLLRRLIQTRGSLLSAENLRSDPGWDALRKAPGFQALLANAASRER